MNKKEKEKRKSGLTQNVCLRCQVRNKRMWYEYRKLTGRNERSWENGKNSRVDKKEFKM